MSVARFSHFRSVPDNADLLILIGLSLPSYIFLCLRNIFLLINDCLLIRWEFYEIIFTINPEMYNKNVNNHPKGWLFLIMHKECAIWSLSLCESMDNRSRRDELLYLSYFFAKRGMDDNSFGRGNYLLPWLYIR